MPYDPRQQLMQRGGIPPAFDPATGPPGAPANRWWEQGQQAPRPGVQFAPPPPPQQPKQWYEQAGQSANQPANSPKGPPSLIDMMMGLGKMTRPEYDKAMQGQGAYGVPTKDAARFGPWGLLGSMGLPGGPGWGGGTPG